MESTVVRVEAHPTRTRYDAWCDTCLASTRVEVDFSLVFSDSLRVFARYTGSYCPGCGE